MLPTEDARALGPGLLAVALAVVAARADDADEVSGWLAIYRSDGGRASSVAATASFHLEEGEAFHPALGAAGGEAVFAARIELASSGDYRFGLEVEGGEGELVVLAPEGAELARCDGAGGERPWTDWLALPAEPVRVEVRFRRDGARAARLRTMWEERLDATGGFPPEPIPTRRAFAPEEARAVHEWERATLRGLALLERKGCTNCHEPGEAGVALVGERPAPRLDGIGGRLGNASGSDWARAWIRDPSSKRAGADMPRMWPQASGAAEGEARALAAYLWERTREGDAAEADDARAATEASVLERGRALYHRIGCVACHGALASPAELHGDPFLPDEVPDAPVIAPFGDLTAKWRAAALASFLRDPAATHPDGRMPSLALTEEVSDAIASYLVDRWGDPLAGEPAVVTNGEPAAERRDDVGALFDARSCAACHELEGHEPPPPATPLAELAPERGCLDPLDAETPRYDLDAEDRRAITIALDEVRRATGAPAPLLAERRAFDRLGCASCHARAGEGGVDPALTIYFQSADEEVDLGDEGRLPPDLTAAGAKLTTSWMRSVLLEGGRARPYLAARMPRYAEERVGGLAERLAKREGIAPDTDVLEPEVADDDVLVGRDLMDRTALGCITCHVYADREPAGTPGPAITRFGERLRYEWYRSYLVDPQRYRPGTRMPGFGRGNESTLADVLEGDLGAQVDAMWAYFSLGEFMPPPAGLAEPTSLAIRVTDRPIVLRTFLEEAGSRGIAVGFPTGIHVAFDAGGVRLAGAWRGAFLDASGAWAGRGGTVTGGRGPAAWEAPPGPPLQIGDTASNAWPTATGSEAGLEFRGYRLDPAGVPTFLYDLDGFRIEERVETRVAPSERILRRFRFPSLPAGTTIEAMAGEPAEGGAARVRAVAGFEREGLLDPVGPGASGGARFRLRASDASEVRVLSMEIEL